MQETISPTVTPNRRVRRTYTKEFKAQVVAESDQDDRSIAQVAMKHQINANLIHKWSRQLKATDLQQMVPVAVNSAAATSKTDNNRIEVLVGNVTVRFFGSVDQHNARAVLGVLDALR